MSAVPVRDFLANTPEQIQQIAKIIGSGERLQIFEAAYFHKSPVKTVAEIVVATGLSRKSVLMGCQALSVNHILTKTRKNGELAYEIVPDIKAHKPEIIRLAKDRKARDKLVTKRKVSIAGPIVVRTATQKPRALSITVDDVTSFSKVRSVRANGNLPSSVSEDEIKRGVQAVLREVGSFKDWGGENSDLYSGRLVLAGKRRRVAFAFKGPGFAGNWCQGRWARTATRFNACSARTPTCSSFSTGERLAIRYPSSCRSSHGTSRTAQVGSSGTALSMARIRSVSAWPTLSSSGSNDLGRHQRGCRDH